MKAIIPRKGGTKKSRLPGSVSMHTVKKGRSEDSPFFSPNNPFFRSRSRKAIPEYPSIESHKPAYLSVVDFITKTCDFFIRHSMTFPEDMLFFRFNRRLYRHFTSSICHRCSYSLLRSFFTVFHCLAGEN